MWSSFSVLVSSLLSFTQTFGGLYPGQEPMIIDEQVPEPLGVNYKLSDKIIGNDFYNAFAWQAIPDPTHGRVQYVDQTTSRNLNLTYASSDTFVLRADSTTVLSASGPGRRSVRIQTKKTYTNHVAVFDIRHMPQGCGTWPAVWSTTVSGWPNGGEIDILEGVNDRGPNSATLHTTAGCSMPGNIGQSGVSTQLDCNWQVNGNAGCGVKFDSYLSYGPPFNDVGGGWYALERTPTYIKVWFWPRNSPDVPWEIKGGASVANPDLWHAPVAYFPDTKCQMSKYFTAHAIIINLTLCGDWAGGVFGSSGCPGNCVDYVNTKPGAFSNAYFDFASIRIYTP